MLRLPSLEEFRNGLPVLTWKLHSITFIIHRLSYVESGGYSFERCALLPFRKHSIFDYPLRKHTVSSTTTPGQTHRNQVEPCVVPYLPSPFPGFDSMILPLSFPPFLWV